MWLRYKKLINNHIIQKYFSCWFHCRMLTGDQESPLQQLPSLFFTLRMIWNHFGNSKSTGEGEVLLRSLHIIIYCHFYDICLHKFVGISTLETRNRRCRYSWAFFPLLGWYGTTSEARNRLAKVRFCSRASISSFNANFMVFFMPNSPENQF